MKHQADIGARAGIGARPPHIARILSERPRDFAWVETHAENYMSAGGPMLDDLESLRALYPLSLHGVGLSLISTERLDRDHLAQLKKLIARFQPALVSEHLAWSRWDGRFYNDLFPVPMTAEALAIACERVDEAQTYLARQILIENPSLYGSLAESDMAETDFLRALAERTGCGLLLDINNVFVSSYNLSFDAYAWLDDFPSDHIGEVHLAGHSVIEFEDRQLCIDDHGSRVTTETWALAAYMLRAMGGRPLLIEWDNDIPELEILCAEARRAQSLLDGRSGQEAEWISENSKTASPRR